jgi:hypothetical protein
MNKLKHPADEDIFTGLLDSMSGMRVRSENSTKRIALKKPVMFYDQVNKQKPIASKTEPNGNRN